MRNCKCWWSNVVHIYGGAYCGTDVGDTGVIHGDKMNYEYYVDVDTTKIHLNRG